MHCRIDFIDMAQDGEALNRLAAGLNDLWNRGIIQARANEHDVNFMNGIHWAPQFLPWHRHFLLRLEQDLRAFDARTVLPYWDWTRADSRRSEESRVGKECVSPCRARVARHRKKKKKSEQLNKQQA